MFGFAAIYRNVSVGSGVEYTIRPVSDRMLATTRFSHSSYSIYYARNSKARTQKGKERYGWQFPAGLFEPRSIPISLDEKWEVGDSLGGGCVWKVKSKWTELRTREKEGDERRDRKLYVGVMFVTV